MAVSVATVRCATKSDGSRVVVAADRASSTRNSVTADERRGPDDAPAQNARERRRPSPRVSPAESEDTFGTSLRGEICVPPAMRISRPVGSLATSSIHSLTSTLRRSTDSAARDSPGSRSVHRGVAATVFHRSSSVGAREHGEVVLGHGRPTAAK